MTDHATGALDWARPGQGNGLRWVIAMTACAVLLQVAILPRFDIGPIEGIPNVVVCVVVAVALLRGVVVGAVVGFAAGMLVELLTPGETLGVLALVYVAIGAWCGRFAGGNAAVGRWFAVSLMVGATVLVPLWMGLVYLLRGDGPPLGYLLGDIVVPQLIFAPLVAIPVWWAAQRLLGPPREVEPWMARGVA